MKKICVIMALIMIVLSACMADSSENNQATKADSMSVQLDTVIDSYNFEGVAVIYRNDAKIYESYTGYADIADKRINSSVDVYRIGSLTKQFTATSICMLYEEGKINFSDKVEKYFPTAKYGKKVTIKDLLNMSSGIPNYSGSTEESEIRVKGTYTEKQLGFSISADNSADENTEIIEKWILSQSLQFNPQEKFDYSNSNYFLLARIIEKVSGRSYEEYITENIINQLNLKQTSFNDKEITAEGYIYDSIDNEATFMKNKDLQWVLYPGAMFGSASMKASADDLYKWIKALRNGEIVNKETYEFMIEENPSGYGMGFFTNNVACFHTGQLGSYVSYLGFAKDTDFVVITISNTYNDAVDFSEMSVQLGNIAMTY